MSEKENIDTKLSYHLRTTSLTEAKSISNSESNGTEPFSRTQPKLSSTPGRELLTSNSTRSSSLESPQAMDPMVLRRAQSEDGALELPALSGTDLASFALTRSHTRLSTADLNIIGMALLKDAVSAEKPDHRAAAAVFSAMANVNAKVAGPKKVGATDRVRAALEKAASAIEAERKRKRTVLDIPAEPNEEEQL